MILADAPIWIDHLRTHDRRLAAWLAEGEVCIHPHVIGELALGSLKDRDVFLNMLSDLPSSVQASHGEVLSLVEQLNLFARGIGYTDAHLVATSLLTPHTKLWTKDRRLGEVASELGIAAEIA